MADNSLVAKLQKILALTKSPVEGEAQAAAEMLAKLLTKHNLEVADLERQTGTVAAVGEERFDRLGQDVPEWKLSLAQVLAKHFYCYAIVNYSSRREGALFIGRPENVDALKAMYTWLLRHIYSISCEEHKAHPHIDGRRWHRPFCEGVVDRLETRLQAMREREHEVAPEAMALVVNRDAEIGDYMEERFGYRRDGRETAAQRKRREADEELLRSDPDAYYRKYPWQRPLTPEQEAAQEARQEAVRAAERKRAERRERARQQRPPSAAQRERNAAAWDRWDARRAGHAASERVNLEPFLKGGKSAQKLA